MNLHITNFRERWVRVSTIAQTNVAEIAKTLGFKEIALCEYPLRGYKDCELQNMLYGAMAGVEEGDIVVVQSPMYQHQRTASYERTLISALFFHFNVRLAIFVHDVPPFQNGGTNEEWEATLQNYNMADLLILPSKGMYEILREKGLKVENVLFQEIFDIPFDGELCSPKFQRKILFSGPPDRFRFVYSWGYDIPLHIFGKSQYNMNNVHPEGWKNTTELLIELSKGGFGLVWEQTDYSLYYRFNQPYKLVTYLEAGIPVIVQKESSAEIFVEKYKVGFVVESLDEAVHAVSNITEDEYYQLVRNIKNIGFMMKNGMFTKKLLLKAVFNLLSDNTLYNEQNGGKNYRFLKENQCKFEALICTDSDEIEHCEDLVKELPQMHFHIAAYTEMSPKLRQMEQYENVSLYPNVDAIELNRLFENCDYYFDINYWSEIASAVYRAFISNHLIFAFEETVHQRGYVAEVNIYPISDYERMLEDIKTVMEDKELLKQRLDEQRKMR